MYQTIFHIFNLHCNLKYFKWAVIQKQTGPKNMVHVYQHGWNLLLLVLINLNFTCKTVFYRCNTCGVYIYKGKKFNSRKEDVEDETFLGLRIFRFYIKCPSCVSEIAFKVFFAYHQYTW